MGISSLEALHKSFSSFFHLSSAEDFRLVQKYHHEIKEILNPLKPVLDAIVDSEIASDELPQTAVTGLSQSVDKLTELIQSYHPLTSKVYFVLQVESFIEKVTNYGLEILEFLKCSDLSFPDELSLAYLQSCIKKIRNIEDDHISSIITNVTQDQVEGYEPDADSLAKITDCLNLNSNQELLIEAVGLEKLKENIDVQAENNGEAQCIDKLIIIVTHMHESFVTRKQNQRSNPVSIPPDFCCPLSLELMRDPVIVASGQTYERAFIREWIDNVLTVCPKTRQILSHDNLIPNYTVKALIANWCKICDVERLISAPTVETRADLSGVENSVLLLVEDMKSDSDDKQREATRELRLLAKHNMDNRIVIANCGAIVLLVNLLYSTDKKVQENAVTTLLNLSINDINKMAISNADAIDPLIHVLETGSPQAKENSAATLFSLSVIEDNKIKIGRSRVIEPLVDLLRNGTPRGKKDAATALFNLSIFHENKERVVDAGAVEYLMKMMDPAAGMVDKVVAVLSNLATIPRGRVAIGYEGGICVLVEVVELGSARGKEHAAAALLQLCTNSSRFCNIVLEEGAIPPLVALSQTGTPRAKEKAQALLGFFRSRRHGNGGRA